MKPIIENVASSISLTIIFGQRKGVINLFIDIKSQYHPRFL